MREYSESFKRKLVQRMTGPDPQPVASLALEVGVGKTSLYRWLLEARTLERMSKNDSQGSGSPPPRRPDDRRPEEKLRLLIEASQVPEEELGAFLRREGLHEADLAAWREAMLAGLRPSASRKKASGESKRMRELERELRRKDKALAEAAALLVLQKKVRDIWGDGDDDTEPRNDE